MPVAIGENRFHNNFFLLTPTLSTSNSFVIMHSLKTLRITLIQLQLFAIVLTATLALPRATVPLTGSECLEATVSQIPHTVLSNPFQISPQVPPANLSSHGTRYLIDYSGGYITYDVQPILLNLIDILEVFQKAIHESKQHPWGSPVGMSKVYESADVELLFYPEQIMTWRDLGCASRALRGYMERSTNFSIFDKQWNQFGKGKLGLV